MSRYQRSLREKDWLGLPLPAWAILVVTVVLSSLWSWAHLMWVDEFLEFYTDSLPTFGDVMRVQLHYPIVIDPPLQHMMTHAFMDLLGANAASLRLASLIGFLLFQVCVYLFASRMAGRRAGIVAMLFPLFTCTVQYSQNGRPYALLMGLFMLSLVCWQRAVRAGEAAEPRMLVLVGLWLALALAMSTQFFGVLVLLPVWIGEIVRTISRRRIDKAVVGMLALGTASVIVILPFLGATKIYQRHYLPPDTSMRFVVDIYRTLLEDGPFQFVHPVQVTIFAVFVLALLVGAAVRIRRHIDTSYEWAALIALGLLPVFGHVLEVHVTHTLMPRYVLPAVGAFAVGGGVVLAAAMRRSGVYYATAALMLALGLAINVQAIRLARVERATILAGFEETPAVKAELDSRLADKLYFQTLTQYFIASYYEPDAQRRDRMVLLTAEPELKWQGKENLTILTENLHHFSPLPIVPYDEFLAFKNPLVVVYKDQADGDTWIDRDLHSRGHAMTPVGPWLSGMLTETHSAQTDRP